MFQAEVSISKHQKLKQDQRMQVSPQPQKISSKAVIEKCIQKITFQPDQGVVDIEWYYKVLDSPTFRGGVLGAIITAFVSWNTGHNGRVGKFLKHWNFVRHFIRPKHYGNFCPITNYHHADLDYAANNFYCYSGESGVGKSKHFQQIVSAQSQKRPAIYVSFKAVGRKENFENDLAEQLNCGEAATTRGGILGELVRAVKQIQIINENSQKFIRKFMLINAALLATYVGVAISPIYPQFQIAFLGPVLLANLEYIRFMEPLIRQAKRRSIPVIVFDDLNKLDHLGMLAQITRFFKILEAKSANLIMVSSNEETWSKLRKEPGMKDRLRIRQLRYNHQQTSYRLVELIKNKPDVITKYFSFHPIFDPQLIQQLARVFIGVKQMSIRRFTSVLRLVDEEEYDKLVYILKNRHNKTAAEVVQAMRDVIFQTQVHTMVSHIRSIKRQLPYMPIKTFILTLKAVVKHQKLPSDNKIGALLRVYNIMRDMRSEYVINGGYMLKIFEMAIEEYLAEMKQYDLPEYTSNDFKA